jgi:hypothetical protein
LSGLVFHGLVALQESLTQDLQLSSLNTTIAVVGKDQVFKILNGEETEVYLKVLREKRPRVISRDVLMEMEEHRAEPGQETITDETGAVIGTVESGVTPPMSSMEVDEDSAQ